MRILVYLVLISVHVGKIKNYNIYIVLLVLCSYKYQVRWLPCLKFSPTSLDVPIRLQKARTTKNFFFCFSDSLSTRACYDSNLFSFLCTNFAKSIRGFFSDAVNLEIPYYCIWKAMDFEEAL